VEVVHQVMEIDFPVKFCIRRLWEITSGLFATASILEKFFINVKRFFEVPPHIGGIDVDDTLRSLVVHFRLSTKYIWAIIFLGDDRISRR
jgi:hypothetical protein